MTSAESTELTARLEFDVLLSDELEDLRRWGALRLSDL
jgi:hypothetical protein